MNSSTGGLLTLLALLTLTAAAHAGTVIQSRDDVGGTSTVKIEGDMARIDNGDDSGHMLIDMKTRKVYAINDDDHMVLDASTPMPAPQSSGGEITPPTSPTVTKVGDGPKIAGYPTIHYRVLVGNETCFDEYLAKQPLENKDVLHFTQMMSRWTHQQRVSMGAMYADEDECDAAEGTVTEQYPKLGIPMRTVDSAGTVIHEITLIQSKESFPSNIFKLPTDYPVLTKKELMERMQETPSGDDQTTNPDQLEEMQQNMQEMYDEMRQQE